MNKINLLSSEIGKQIIIFLRWVKTYYTISSRHAGRFSGIKMTLGTYVIKLNSIGRVHFSNGMMAKHFFSEQNVAIS